MSDQAKTLVFGGITAPFAEITSPTRGEVIASRPIIRFKVHGEKIGRSFSFELIVRRLGGKTLRFPAPSAEFELPVTLENGAYRLQIRTLLKHFTGIKEKVNDTKPVRVYVGSVGDASETDTKQKFWGDRWRDLSDEEVLGFSLDELSALAIWPKIDADKIARAKTRYERYEAFMAATISELDLNVASFADFGTAYGRWVEYARSAYGIMPGTITALDVVPGPLSFVERRNPGVRTRVFDLSRDTYDGEKHDLAVVFGVLHHLTDEGGFRQAFRSLAAAAKIVLVGPIHYGEAPPRRYKRYWGLSEYQEATKGLFEEVTPKARMTNQRKFMALRSLL